MLKFLINFFSQSLEFSRTEAKGTLVLIFIIVLGVTASQLYLSLSWEEKRNLNPTQEKELQAWVTEVRASIEVKKVEEKTEEIRGDYTVPTRDSERSVKAEQRTERLPQNDVPTKKIMLLDLNTATVEALQKIYGIGPAFSERIVKYRSLLGGYSAMSQLIEVYGLNHEVINELSKYYQVGSPPRKIDINTDSAKVLARHPYISYDLAWTIINYRKQNGNISALEDLKKVKSIDADTFEKLRPYLE